MDGQIMNAINLAVVGLIGAFALVSVAVLRLASASVDRKANLVRLESQRDKEKLEQDLADMREERLETQRKHEEDIARIRERTDTNHALNASIEHLIDIMVDQVQSERARGMELNAGIFSTREAISNQTQSLGELIEVVDSAGQKVGETHESIESLKKTYEERNPRLFEQMHQIENTLNALVEEVQQLEGIPAQITASLEQHKRDVLAAVAQLCREDDRIESAS